jgi:hypothetical protein
MDWLILTARNRRATIASNNNLDGWPLAVKAAHSVIFREGNMNAYIYYMTMSDYCVKMARIVKGSLRAFYANASEGYKNKAQGLPVCLLMES